MKTLHKKCPNKQKHKKTKKRNYKKGGTAIRNSAPYIPTTQDNIDLFINGVEMNIVPGTTYSPRHQFGNLSTDLETILPLDSLTTDDLDKVYSTAEIRIDDISSEIEQLINRRNKLARFLPRLHNLIDYFETHGQMPQQIGISSDPSF